MDWKTNVIPHNAAAPPRGPALAPRGSAGAGGQLVTAATLRALPMFQHTAPAALEAIARTAMMRLVRRHAYVVLAGNTTDFVYFVQSGSLNVMIGDDDGREAILSMLGPGEMFGEMGVLDDSVRSATVVAVTPCVLIMLTKSDFRRYLRENFDMALYVMRKLAQRLRTADRRIESLALLDVGGRVARLLHDISEPCDEHGLITRRVTKQEIAKMVGASREMVSRVLKDMQARDLIDEEDGRYILREIGPVHALPDAAEVPSATD